MSRLPHREQGATLVISLIIMLLLTILGVTATQMMIMQEKMTSNMRDKQVSFQAAESALIQAEQSILAANTAPNISSGCTGFPCVNPLTPDMKFSTQSSDWWDQSGVSISGDTLGQVKTQPKYYVEFYRFVPDDPTIGHGQASGIHYYRITARGTGGSDTANSYLQSTVAKRY